MYQYFPGAGGNMKYTYQTAGATMSVPCGAGISIASCSLPSSLK